MSATENIVCYKSKKLSNGESSLMISVYKDGKRKYKSLGMSVHPDHWDFQKNNQRMIAPTRNLRSMTKDYFFHVIKFRIFGI